MKSELDLEAIKNLRIAYKSLENIEVKSLSFHNDGKSLIYTTQNKIKFLILEDERVRDFSFKVERHGGGLSVFQDEGKVVHTSFKNDFHLRLLDVEKNKYVHYFPGHAKEVISVDAITNHIVSGSEDTSVRLWDPRRQESIFRLTFPSTPLVAFHPSGDLLVIAYSSHLIQFHDLKNLKTICQTIQLERIAGVEWTSIKFSSDSTMLLVTTNSSLILAVDIIQKVERLNLRDFDNRDKSFIGACFTPGSDYILSGSRNGSIAVWDVKSPIKVHSIPKYQVLGFCRNVAFNPQFINMATVHDSIDGGSIVSLWIERL